MEAAASGNIVGLACLMSPFGPTLHLPRCERLSAVGKERKSCSLIAEHPACVLDPHFIGDAGPRQPHKLGKRRVWPARATRQRRNEAGHSRVAVSIERAQVDRVRGPSKQVIVIQKQDCAGLVLVHTVPSSTWVVQGDQQKTLEWDGPAPVSAGLANDDIYVSND
jgi:hypothetical protein